MFKLRKYGMVLATPMEVNAVASMFCDNAKIFWRIAVLKEGGEIWNTFIDDIEFINQRNHNSRRMAVTERLCICE